MVDEEDERRQVCKCYGHERCGSFNRKESVLVVPWQMRKNIHGECTKQSWSNGRKYRGSLIPSDSAYSTVLVGISIVLYKYPRLANASSFTTRSNSRFNGNTR